MEVINLRKCLCSQSEKHWNSKCPFSKYTKIVKIDRGTQYGNPFILGVDGNREEVIRKYVSYAVWRLRIDPYWLNPLMVNVNYLACWCEPELCHGHVLNELVMRKLLGEEISVKSVRVKLLGK